MKTDLNIDCPLSFSILLDEELEQYNLPAKRKEKLHDLLLLVFKEGMRCGQRPENNIRYKEMAG
jgi:hypothetical protein